MRNEQIKTGQLTGGILLVAGCCIGAGMLGLPVVTGAAGFIPSVAMFVVSWLFMLTTGLLLLEVNLFYGHEAGIVSMAGQTLGRIGRALAWSVFLFLFYCLTVAYVAGIGTLIAGVLSDLLHVHTPDWAGCALAAGLFGGLVYLGTSTVDKSNRLLMVGKILSYLLLIVLGTGAVRKEFLLYQRWSATITALPILIVSFGYHNMVPSLAHYYKGQQKALKVTLVVGSALPLVVYLVWEALVLGIVPLAGMQAALAQGQTASQALQQAIGNSAVALIAQYFAFFALATSFLAVTLSFVHFLADGFRVKRDGKGRIALLLIVLAPSVLFAIANPTVFISALNYAGGIGAVILFGIMPALMAWVKRYRKHSTAHTLVSGGKPILILIMAFAAFVFALQIAQTLGFKVL